MSFFNHQEELWESYRQLSRYSLKTTPHFHKVPYRTINNNASVITYWRRSLFCYPSKYAKRIVTRPFFNPYSGDTFEFDYTTDVIHPLSPFSLTWRILKILVCCMNTLTFQLSTSVLYWEVWPSVIYLNFIFEIFMITDVLVSFKTGHIDEKINHLETRSSEVVRNYMETKLGFHVLTSIPCQLIASTRTDNTKHSYGSLFIVTLRLVALPRIIRFYEVANRCPLGKSLSTYYWYGLAFYAVSLILTLHLLLSFADTLMLLGAIIDSKIEKHTVFENLLGRSILGHDWLQIYCIDISRLTMGFILNYNITTTTETTEDILFCLLIYVAGMMFALWAMHDCHNFIITTNYGRNEKSILMGQVNAMLRARKAPDNLSKRLNIYCNYYNARIEIIRRTNVLLNSLSQNLKAEVMVRQYSALLRGVLPSLTQDDATVVSLLSRLKVEIYLPGDVVYANWTEGEQSKQMIIVEYGVIGTYDSDVEDPKTSRIVIDGGLVTQSDVVKARALTCCVLIILEMPRASLNPTNSEIGTSNEDTDNYLGSDSSAKLLKYQEKKIRPTAHFENYSTQSFNEPYKDITNETSHEHLLAKIKGATTVKDKQQDSEGDTCTLEPNSTDKEPTNNTSSN